MSTRSRESSAALLFVLGSIALHVQGTAMVSFWSYWHRPESVAANQGRAGRGDNSAAPRTELSEFTLEPASVEALSVPEPTTPNPQTPLTPQQREREAARRRALVRAIERRPPAEIELLRPPTPPPQQQPSLAHVDQRQSTDNRPTDPNFLSEHNNDVSEQTIAALRGLTQDDPQPTQAPAATQAAGSGSGANDVHAQAQNRAGAQIPSSTQQLQMAAPQQTPNNPPSQASQQAQAAQTAQQAAGLAGTAATTPNSQNQVFASSEGVWGQYALSPENPRPNSPQSGANGANGSMGSGRGLAAARRIGVAGLGAAGTLQALSPTTSSYSQSFGSRVQQERVEAQQRRTESRGTNPAAEFAQVRQAIENYVPAVRVGNQTSLRSAASPFSTYLTAMHRRIHQLFADGFLAGLDGASAESPLQDPTLHCTIEIVIEPDGRIGRVGLARTSGNTIFDVAAVNSVRRSGPFEATPEAIRSADGKTYVHWGFYRSERQCGTFNAEPYILSAPASDGRRERTTIIAPTAGRER